MLLKTCATKPQRTKLKYTWRLNIQSGEFRAQGLPKVTRSREKSAIGRPLLPSSRHGVPLWASGRHPCALLKLHIANVSYFKAANDRLPASHRLSSHREAEHA